MKAQIHPIYHLNAKIICANCGTVFQTGATREELKIEICSQCHPFFTGKKVLIDTEGRADRFMKKAAGANAREKKVRTKLTLEERVNKAISEQLQKEAA